MLKEIYDACLFVMMKVLLTKKYINYYLVKSIKCVVCINIAC